MQIRAHQSIAVRLKILDQIGEHESLSPHGWLVRDMRAFECAVGAAFARQGFEGEVDGDAGGCHVAEVADVPDQQIISTKVQYSGHSWRVRTRANEGCAYHLVEC